MEDRNLFRIANRIQGALMKLKNERYLELLNRLTCFAGQLQELTAESTKMGASLAHSWLFAAERCCGRTSRILRDIPYSVSRIQQLTESPCKEIPTLSMLVDELKQVKQEFGNVDFDKDENTISALTEPVTLEDIYLGPFKIQLVLNKLAELYKGSPYHCIALDPNPAATSEDVTHPHVSNEQLCEGDGSAAIRAALEEGRLSDFFTMVRSILNTYNPDSPYISLHDWDGEPCYDCGYVMDRENSYYCSFCDRSFCEECSTYCHGCDETLCLGCAGKCEICEEPICSNCVCSCAECGIYGCGSCLENEICPKCKEESEAENEEQETEIDTNREERNQPETNNSEIKLAS